MARELNSLSGNRWPVNCDDPVRRSLLSDDAGPGNCSVRRTASIHGNDTHGFEALFKLHHRRVYSICLRMTRDAADAEDLTQDVFLQVFRKLASFRGESAFTTWLHRLTINQVLMHFRKNRVRRERVTEDGELPIETATVQRKPAREGLLDRLALDEAMIRLPMGYRMVFVLHDVEGLEHTEIASILGCSIGTSKSQLHRARMRLRELLSRTNHPDNSDTETFGFAPTLAGAIDSRDQS